MEQVEEKHQVLVFNLTGRLDGGRAADVQARLTPRLEAAPAVLLDCENLDYISSAGLRVVLMAAKECKKAGRPFGLCGLQKDVYEVFRMSGFISVIPTYESRAEALQRLSPRA